MEVSYVAEGNNLVFAGKIGKETASVLYLEPVMTNYGDLLCEVRRVATKEKYQRQGLMDELMKEAFDCVLSEREAFLYLYTVKPELFIKYGFVAIREKPVYKLNPKRISESLLEDALEAQGGFNMLVKGMGTMECHVLREKDCARAARFLTTYNKEHKPLYPVVNEESLKLKKEEIKGEGGDILVLESEGIMKAVFSVRPSMEGAIVRIFAMEDEIKDWEIFKPMDIKESLMVRLVDAGKFWEMILSAREFVLALRIKDDKLVENEGLYLLHCGPEGGSVNAVKIGDENMEHDGERLSAECEVTAEDLVRFAFGVGDASETFRVYVKSKEEEINCRLDELAGIVWE